MKSGKSAALLLMAAAMLGLLLANSPIGSSLIEFKDFHVGFGAINLDLSISHWVSDLLLAVFFLVAGLELKYELTKGVLSKFSTALLPVVAATGGVVVPALIFFSFTAGTELAAGWPIPTATDIAFALGILAIFGSGMPAAARIFLLALAIFDDLVAILIIAVFFTAEVKLVWIGIAAGIGIAHFFIEKFQSKLIVPIRFLTFFLLWYSVYQSGVHATIAGVMLGLIIPAKKSHALVDKVQPWSNTIVLPIFAFFAVAIALPSISGSFSPVFAGILVALPVGKVLGITIFGLLAMRFVSKEARLPLNWQDLVGLSALAGIGFTVSLLMTNLAFKGNLEVIAEATLAVLVGSLISMGVGGAIVQQRSRFHRKQSRLANKAQ
ncbi:MAG: Na+/H+ antiporter NhaA [Aquiluna sp.]|nr:Na+/H+ antiporter NhaA [Aquiluna sp.]MCF8545116.1 Na+/H+ antiporter NhaA [Aquiluna sp.]